MNKLVRAISLALLWLVATVAVAQSTGSSFGGGDWGSGGGSSGGGSSSAPSGYASSGYGSGVSDDDPNAIELPYWAQVLVFFAFMALVYGVLRLVIRTQRGGGGSKIDVAQIQIALDARARVFVQTTLRELGRGGDTQTSTGRVALLSAAISALRSAQLAWIYAGTKSFDPMPAALAQSELKRLSDEARAGFQFELDRSVDGKTSSTTAPQMTAREHEGQGAVLVTILVAARTNLRAVPTLGVSDLDAGLAQLAAITAEHLVAFEVVWTPATENDRMSTDELEKHYPTLTKLAGAVGGRVFCGSCRGPYAAELAKCPHCGAPAA